MHYLAILASSQNGIEVANPLRLAIIASANHLLRSWQFYLCDNRLAPLLPWFFACASLLCEKMKLSDVKPMNRHTLDLKISVDTIYSAFTKVELYCR